MRIAVSLPVFFLVGTAPIAAQPATQGPDASLSRAEVLLADGLPLSASRMLTAELAQAGPEAEPEVVLAAARSYAGIRAWTTVRRLLSERSWLDSLASGEGRLLQALAELEEGDAGQARDRFDRILPTLRERADTTSLLTALVGRARALERLGQDLEAAASWMEAASYSDHSEHWLRLSALQALGRAGEPDRAVITADELRGNPAIPVDSIMIEVARAAFTSGDTAAGLIAAGDLSARAAATLAGEWILPGLLARGDTAEALRLARQALDLRRGSSRVGETYLSLDSTTAALRLVAESDQAAGRTRRAVELRERLLQRATESESAAARLELARAWFARGRYSEVRETLSPWLSGAETQVPGDSERLRSQALFLAGRALYRQGRRDEAIALWRRVADVAGAPDGAYAAYLVADIHHDRGDLDRAAEAYEITVERHPSSGYAGTALFRLGMLGLLQERPTDAMEYFDTYRRRSPGGNWYHASIYWSARSREAAGDSAAAKALYRESLGYDPLGYYGILAATSLGLDAWEEIPRRAMAPLPDPRSRDTVLVESMDLLRDFGWRNRAVRELSTRDRTGETPEVRLRLALLLNERGWTWQGTALADAVRRSGSGAWSDDLLRGVYPLIYEEALTAAAGRQNLDPALVAAITRRESQFDREVASHAGAVGLMQILPRTGSELARRSGISGFEADQLKVAEVNLDLGTLYLRELLDRNGGALAPALISYNAGPHRYARWREFPEFSADAELLVERIPFRETRVYVKTITAYRHIYRHLYDLGRFSVDDPMIEG
ncbi:MAG: transglycosylase SLT domain-containing protein [marine benthic group bacterium]|nr:transglycosylase SLT domain-containing protein [Gemmatimonadota bacterium]